MADGVTKALAIVRRVGKATPKILGYALPAASIGVNALGAWNQGGGNAELAGTIFMKKYIPINLQSGEFQADRLKEGLGSLLISMAVGKVLQYLA